jgi:hypothetical protein
MSKFEKMSKFEELYEKLLSDAEFRQRLFDDPSAALKSIGIEPTPEQLHAMRGIINGVEEVDHILEPLGAPGGEKHHRRLQTCVT